MLYLITNIIASVTIFIVFIISLAMEKWTFKKFSIRIITIMGMMVALSVILTNLISYNISIMSKEVQIALGDWILFLQGMVFGPLCGVIGAIATDALGYIINISGSYHCGFMLDKVLLGFAGALVFTIFSKKFWYIIVIFLYSITLLFESLVLNSIWLYSSGFTDVIFINIVFKLIKFPIVAPIYIALVIASFKVIRIIIKKWTQDDIWCIRARFAL